MNIKSRKYYIYKCTTSNELLVQFAELEKSKLEIQNIVVENDCYVIIAFQTGVTNNESI